MSARRAVCMSVSLAVSLGVVFCLVSVPAFAVLGHARPSFSPFGSFVRATRLAIDQSDGNVFVADSNANDVRVFNAEGGTPAGGIPAELTGAQTPAGSFADDKEYLAPGIAVDSACHQQGLAGAACTSFDLSNGNIYVSDLGHNVVDKFRINALNEYEYVCQFTGYGFTGSACLKNEPTIEKTPTEVSFGGPDGVAVDREGNIYISDYKSRTIYEYTSKGEDVRKFQIKAYSPIEFARGRDEGVVTPPAEVSVDETGDLYVHGSEAEVGLYRLKRSSFTGGVESVSEIQTPAMNALIIEYLAIERVEEEEGKEGHLPSEQTQKESLKIEQEVYEVEMYPRGFAFDEVTGKLTTEFERSGNFSLLEYGQGGEFESTFDPENTGNGAANIRRGVAVNETSGDVYVVSADGKAVDVFTSLVALGSATTGKVVTGGRTSVTVEGTVNPESKTLEGSCIVEYGTTTAYGSSVPCSPGSVGTGETPVHVTAVLTGLLASTTYHYRVVAVNTNGGNPGLDATVETLPSVEGVLTGEAIDLSQTSAVFTGSLRPNGMRAHYYFQYGETTGYGSTVPAPPGLETGTEPEKRVEIPVSGLKVNTEYHYRLVATNELGTTYGHDQTLITLPNKPSVISETASEIYPGSTLLSAVVNPETASTTYHFVYGPTEAYGSSAPTSDLTLGSGAQALQALLTVEGLLPSTTYHYAIVATNRGGSTVGSDETFTTLAAALPSVTTGEASEMSANSVTLTGTVDPGGVRTMYEFDLGTDTTYGSRVFGGAGSGNGPVGVSVGVQGLAAGTLYHYRLLARNEYGTVYGVDETFLTPGFPSSLLVAPVTAPLVPTPVFQVPSVVGAITVAANTQTANTKTKKKNNAKKTRAKKAKKARKARKARKVRGVRSSTGTGGRR
ncbi:MAG: hypothetical protein WA484_11020 [Solirubrobacteraceae bacterium]